MAHASNASVARSPRPRTSCERPRSHLSRAAFAWCCSLLFASATAAPPPRVIALEEAYDRALATDQSIRIAFLEVRKANLLPWSALTRLGLQVNGHASYLRREQATTGGALDPLAGASAERTLRARAGAGQAGLTVEQPLVDLTVFPAYRLGKISAEAARLAHRFTVRETLFGVATAYYEVLKQQRLVDVNREGLRLANEQLDLAQ